LQPARVAALARSRARHQLDSFRDLRIFFGQTCTAVTVRRRCQLEPDLLLDKRAVAIEAPEQTPFQLASLAT
jgi:hypothetical protein